MKFYIQQFIYWLQGKNPIYETFLRGKDVLDMGCGEGKLLEYDKSKIQGVDLNEKEVTRLLSQGFRVKLEGVTHTSFDPSSFDVIVSDNVIEHLTPDDAQAMFVEMKRLLRINGTILLKTPLPKIIWNSFGHVKPYTPMAIKKLFRENSREKFDSLKGFKVEGVYYYGFYSKFKPLFLLYYLLGMLIPYFRISYLIIIKKYE